MDEIKIEVAELASDDSFENISDHNGRREDASESERDVGATEVGALVSEDGEVIA